MRNRRKPCPTCQKPIWYTSAHCRQHARAADYALKACATCKAEFKPVSGRQDYCQPCRVKRFKLEEAS